MVGVDDICGYLAIELSSLVQQFEQLAADIAEQQRARGIETDALHSLRQTNPQPHHSVITKSRPGGGGQHRAATERQHAGEWQRLGGDLFFQGTECRLPVVGEDVSDRFSRPLDNDGVDIAEPDPSRSASSAPTVLFPEPGAPTRMIGCSTTGAGCVLIVVVAPEVRDRPPA